MAPTLGQRPRRNTWRDAAWLVAFCTVIYLFGLTSHGLTNWQESQRALVAREMFERGEWLVPTVHGEPYIAKPPMIYWIQMVIAHARRAVGFEPFVDEFEVRLTVALGGIAGVLATYFAARSIFRRREGAPFRGALLSAPLAADDARVGDDAAWLAALGLASGVLYVRSSRIGELDVLIVPFAMTAIAAIVAAWRRHLEGRSTHWAALVLATIMACGAGLTKGPPALLVIALGAYGPMLLLSRRPRASDDEGSSVSRFGPLAAILGGVGFFVLALALDDRIPSIWHAMGLVFFTFCGALLGWTVVRLAMPHRLGVWFRAFHATHPIGVLGVAALVIWWWKSAVASRVGSETVAALAAVEVEDNLRLLVLDSPTKNLGFMLYGIVPMSVIALVGAISLVRRRRVMSPGRWSPLIWCGLAFVAFSALGKGVARYLTPTWPAVAMVGGLWLALHERERRRRNTPPLMHIATFLFILAGVAQGLWYGVGREMWYASRSPRDVVKELLPRIDANRLGVWALDDPALDYYARQRVEKWGGRGQPGIVDLASIVRMGSGSYWLLASRDAVASREERTPLIVTLRGMGIDVRPHEVTSRYTWRADGTPIVVWELRDGSVTSPVRP